MASYNRTRYVEELLEKTESLPPSFTIHLHLEYWTLNNGSKFLYNNQIASLLDDVRAYRIPVDFLDLFEAAKVPFYDGCMIVELLDYRPQRNREQSLEKPERTRAVLHPNSETLWADICAMNQRHGGKWTDRDTLEVEARMTLATSPPLCLDPNPHLTRIANHVMRVSTPTVPVSLKRKSAALDPEEDETDKARRAKIMSFMKPGPIRSTPSYRILDAIQRKREKRDIDPDQPIAAPSNTTITAPSPTKPPTPAISVTQAPAPAETDDKNTKSTPTPVATFARANGPLTPAPQAATHQFINQNPSNPSPTSNAHSPLQPQVYPNVQAATEAAAKRTPTPAQVKKYTPPPRPPPSKTPAPGQQPPHNIPPPQTNAFQGQLPNAHFLSSQPPARGATATAKVVPINGTKPATQQQAHIGSLTPQQQAQYFYALQQQQMQQHIQQQHHLQQHHLQQQQQNIVTANAAAALQQQRAKNGRATPQVPGQSAPSPGAPRNSPMTTSKPLASRSPMPPTTQLPSQTQPTQLQPQQPQHPAQHPQHTFTPSYNPSQLRPMVHGNPQLPPHLAAAVAATGQAQGASVTPTADGAQPQPGQHMYPMYNYSPMNMNLARQLQQQYWQQQQSMAGRPTPVSNGQPAGAVHPHSQPVAAKVGTPGR